MARRSNRRKKGQTDSPLLELGIKALVAGIGMLFVSAAMGGSAIFTGVAGALKTPALLAMGAGAVLLGLHALTKKKIASEAPGSPLSGAGAGSGANAGTASNQIKANLLKTKAGGPKEPRWNAAVFAAVEWRRFEAVCELLFAQAGFETRSQSHGADGGVDIWLHSKNAVGPVAVVQCKHWQGKPVGVKELREFFGVMASHGLKRGTYATTSTYTADAKAFAQANGISAMDGPALLNLITTQRTPEQQAALLEVAYEGEYWRPTCASCGIKLVERNPAKGGAPFWGCANYPRCKTRIYKTANA
jgi:restriction system protein